MQTHSYLNTTMTKPIDQAAQECAEKTQETKDAELLALSALANIEAVLMAGENAQRTNQGYSPAYTDGTGMLRAGEELRVELFKRGYKV